GEGGMRGLGRNGEGSGGGGGDFDNVVGRMGGIRRGRGGGGKTYSDFRTDGYDESSAASTSAGASLEDYIVVKGNRKGKKNTVEENKISEGDIKEADKGDKNDEEEVPEERSTGDVFKSAMTVGAKSVPQSKFQSEPEPQAQLRESQTSTQSQSDFFKEELGPEAQLRESQISTQSYSDSDAVGPGPRVGPPAVSIDENFQNSAHNQQETPSTYVSSQGLGSPTEDEGVEAAVESARASSDEDAQNHGQRQEEPLATKIQTSRSGAQMELDVEDDPLHMSSNEVSQNLFQDPPTHLSQNQAVQSQESDSDASLDLDKVGKPVWLATDELFWKTIHGSTHHIANPNINPPAQSDPEPALQNLHSNTENRPESTESASSSSVSQYQKVQTTEMTLREKEEKLEDHETMLSNLIDELMIELKKIRGELKRISRRYRKALADLEKASD
ncbi:hypothetical protein BPAE_0112g00010, partial [Botrytis paeoniae]